MSRAQNEMIVRMADALRYVKRLISVERKSQFNSFTIPPNRSFEHMNKDEAAAIRRFDRVLAKIDEAESRCPRRRPYRLAHPAGNSGQRAADPRNQDYTRR